MSESHVTHWSLDWLYQQLEEKESIINGISDALMLLDAHSYEIRQVNRAFLNLYKVSRDQVIGKTCHEITHHLPQPCSKISDLDPCPLEKSVSTGGFSQAEHVHKDHEGNDLYIEVSSYPIKDADGNVTRIIYLSRDVTDRRVAEEALKEGSEKIKLFAYSVAHDLKSPTVGIHGLTKRLYQNYKGVLDEKGQDYCEQILKASEQIVALVDKINVFISTREVPLRIERIRLKEILKAIREEFSEQLQIRKIRLSEPSNNPDINADRLAVGRTLRNLVDNALKYGGDNLNEIRIGYEESDGYHVLSVRDDGMGIKDEDAERIFGLFERENFPRRIEGAGLGLAIVKEIAEQHKGKVWTQPEKEGGITFYFAISKELKPQNELNSELAIGSHNVHRE
jgi:PAS domain S-box-containing protein